MYRKVLVAFVLLIVLLMTACTTAQTKPTAASTSTSKPTSSKPNYGGTLRFGTYAEANTYDMMMTIHSAETRGVMSIFDPLISMDIESGTLQPGLAESWTVAPDGLSVTLKLRKGVKFHDGTDFNAKAVKVNIERQCCNPKSVAKWWGSMEKVSSVDVIDDYTAKINLKSTHGPILYFWTDMWGNMMSPASIEKWGEEVGRHPVGTGPFKFVEWIKDDHTTLTKNPDYWKKDKNGNKLPYLDGIVLKPIPDDSVRLVNLRSGALDLVEYIRGADVARIKTEPELKYDQRLGVGYDSIPLRCSTGPLSNKKVRQALNYAIDREAIIKAVYFGLAEPAKSLISPRHPYYDQSLQGYSYNIEKAKALLKEAGYENGFEFTNDVINQAIRQQAMEAVQSQLAKLGIKMNMKTNEITALIDKWNKGDFQASLFWWGGTSDISKYYDTGYNRATEGAKVQKCATEKVFDLVDKGLATYDPAERKKIYNELDRILVEESLEVFLYHAYNNVAMSKKVQNYKIALPVVFFFNEVWMEK